MTTLHFLPESHAIHRLGNAVNVAWWMSGPVSRLLRGKTMGSVGGKRTVSGLSWALELGRIVKTKTRKKKTEALPLTVSASIRGRGGGWDVL